MHPLLNHYSPRHSQCCSHSRTWHSEEIWGMWRLPQQEPSSSCTVVFSHTAPWACCSVNKVCRPGIYRHCAFCWVTELFCNLFAKLIPNCWVYTFVNTFRLHTVNGTAIWAVSCIYLKLSVLTPRVIYSTPFCEVCYYTADGSAQNSIQK